MKNTDKLCSQGPRTVSNEGLPRQTAKSLSAITGQYAKGLFRQNVPTLKKDLTALTRQAPGSRYGWTSNDS